MSSGQCSIGSYAQSSYNSRVDGFVRRCYYHFNSKNHKMSLPELYGCVYNYKETFEFRIAEIANKKEKYLKSVEKDILHDIYRNSKMFTIGVSYYMQAKRIVNYGKFLIDKYKMK